MFFRKIKKKSVPRRILNWGVKVLVMNYAVKKVKEIADRRLSKKKKSAKK